MRKINPPQRSQSFALIECTRSIQSAQERTHLRSSGGTLFLDETSYIGATVNADFYQLEPFLDANDAVVAGAVTKEELIDLYTAGMLGRKPGKALYDEIMQSADEKCPFCDVSQPNTLEHYLPKAHFPQYSILPINLIPACRYCNPGKKGSTYATVKDSQVLHPYFEDNIFYREKWINANVLHTDPVALEYFVDPPIAWTNTQKNRVETHFEMFNLRARFGIQAAEELSILVDQRRNLMRDYAPEEFRAYLQSIANNNAIQINHWKRVMYVALANDAWFCRTNL